MTPHESYAYFKYLNQSWQYVFQNSSQKWWLAGFCLECWVKYEQTSQLNAVDVLTSSPGSQSISESSFGTQRLFTAFPNSTTFHPTASQEIAVLCPPTAKPRHSASPPLPIQQHSHLPPMKSLWTETPVMLYFDLSPSSIYRHPLYSPKLLRTNSGAISEVDCTLWL